MSLSLEAMLGLEHRSPTQQLAADLVAEHENLLAQLVALREKTATQSDIAARMGISQSAVARIESGDRDLHLSTLRRYAHAVRARVAHTVTPMEAPHVDQHLDEWAASRNWREVVIRKVPTPKKVAS